MKLYVFDHYFYPVKPIFLFHQGHDSAKASLRAQHSIIPCRRHKNSVVKSYMISIYYRNSETQGPILLP